MAKRTNTASRKKTAGARPSSSTKIPDPTPIETLNHYTRAASRERIDAAIAMLSDARALAHMSDKMAASFVTGLEDGTGERMNDFENGAEVFGDLAAALKYVAAKLKRTTPEEFWYV